MNRSSAFDAIRCLKSAWELTTRAPGALWGAGLILVLVDGCSSEFSTDGVDLGYHTEYVDGAVVESWASNPFVVGGALAIAFVMMVVFGLAIAFLRAGFYTGVRAVMQGHEVRFGQMFNNNQNWVPTFFAEVFRVLLIVLGMFIWAATFGFSALILGPGGALAGAVGGLFILLPLFVYFHLGTTFMGHAAALEGLGPMQALARSWSLADGQRFSLIVMYVVQFGLAILGLLAMCLGIFPAAVLSQIMWVEAYVQATDQRPPGSRSAGNSGSPSDPPSGNAAAAAPQDPTPRASFDEPGDFDPGGWRKDLDVPKED